MTALSLSIPKKISPLAIQVIVSVLLTTFLFCIDEGYNDFRWTLHYGNWIVFIFYAASMVLGQALTYTYILKNYRKEGKRILSGLIGVPIGIAILFAIGFSIKYFMY